MTYLCGQQRQSRAGLIALLWCLLTLLSCGSLASSIQSESDSSMVMGMGHMAMEAEHDMPCCDEQLDIDCCEQAAAVVVKDDNPSDSPTLISLVEIRSRFITPALVRDENHRDRSQWLMSSYPRIHLVNSVLLD